LAKYYFEVPEKLSMVLIEKVQSPAFAGSITWYSPPTGRRLAVMKILPSLTLAGVHQFAALSSVN
jgi:hypothetical protein